MSSPDPIEVPYFVWSSGYPHEKICLLGHDYLKISLKIESGDNIFKLIPGLYEKVKKEQNEYWAKRFFPHGHFGTRSEIRFDDRIFSEDGIVKTGKLFIPYYNTVSRKEMEDRLAGIDVDENTRYNEYLRPLKNHPGTSLFYLKGISYNPISTDDVFVLKKEQLE